MQYEVNFRDVARIRVAASCSSVSLEMDWEKFTASVDVLEGCRATTMPAEAPRPVLNSICTGKSPFSPNGSHLLPSHGRSMAGMLMLCGADASLKDCQMRGVCLLENESHLWDVLQATQPGACLRTSL